QARMKQFRAEGVAIVFVSHQLPAVAQLCSQVLLLESGTAARLAPPADVIAAYCHGNGVSEHDDVGITAQLECLDSPRSDTFDVAPGDRLALDVAVEFKLDVDAATVGVVVWDLARELYVYGASSDFVGIPTIRAAAGETRVFHFEFDANLTRGL